MSDSGVIPTPEEKARAALVNDQPGHTGWLIVGELKCPDCGTYFTLNCRLEDVVRFTGVHDCTGEVNP